MIPDEHLPDGWAAASARSAYEPMTDRTFESRAFERHDADREVRIHEVQEPEEFGGWGFQVVAEGPPAGEATIGLYDTLDGAREAAVDFMADHAA